MRIFLKFLRTGLIPGSLLLTAMVFAADQQRETILAEVATSSATTGTPQWLETGSGKFMGLFENELTGKPRGGAILLPPIGAHPNWPGVIRQIRTTLPHYGWSTLSIQMPVVASSGTLQDYADTLPEATARITAAINFMVSQGIRNIALIGSGLGAAGGAAYLAAKPDAGIQAFIGISLSGYKVIGGWLYSPTSISKLALPMLDIYGSLDHRHVLDSADARAEAARQAIHNSADKFKQGAFEHSATAESVQTRRAGYIAFRQIMIVGANAEYSGTEKQLVKRIVGWLKQHAGGIAVEKSNS